MIAMYFIGNPKEEMWTIQVILTNLRCPTIDDYSWYNNILFLSTIFRQCDCNQFFWKEIFISGLSSLFSQKIFLKLF